MALLIKLEGMNRGNKATKEKNILRRENQRVQSPVVGQRRRNWEKAIVATIQETGKEWFDMKLDFVSRTSEGSETILKSFSKTTKRLLSVLWKN